MTLEASMDASIDLFIKQAARLVGECAEEAFDDDVRCWIDAAHGGEPIASPIEQCLLTALLLVIHTNAEHIAEPKRLGLFDFLYGVRVVTQKEIGKYRVDFLIEYYPYPCAQADGTYQQAVKSVVVECDSQQWHERTEPERRYEKSRDRFLVKSGFKVFRYTGRELLANPTAAAVEVISFVLGYGVYDPFEGETDG